MIFLRGYATRIHNVRDQSDHVIITWEEELKSRKRRVFCSLNFEDQKGLGIEGSKESRGRFVGSIIKTRQKGMKKTFCTTAFFDNILFK